MRLRLCFLAIALASAFSPVALAQETPVPEAGSPSPTPEACEIGALCTDVGNRVQPGSGAGQVVDPPGEHVRSLITLSLISLLVGTYLFIALTGRRFLPRVRIRP